METLLPDGWLRPRGYSNGIKAGGNLVFVAGQIAWDSEHRFNSDKFSDQVKSALENVVAVLSAGGARPEHVVRMTWYVTDMAGYRSSLSETGAAYREVMGAHYPVMTLVQVVQLVEPEAKVEIEATAVIPDK